MNLFLGKRFRARDLYKDARFKEADKYIGDGNYYEPDPDEEQAGTSETPTPSPTPSTGGDPTDGD